MFLFGDTLIRIKNAKLAGIDMLEVSYSNLIANLVEILKKVGFIVDYKIFKKGNIKKIKITLNEDLSLINVRFISKPGRRIYLTVNQIKKRKRATGFYLVSTPKGLMLDSQAIKIKQGGEVLCRIW